MTYMDKTFKLHKLVLITFMLLILSVNNSNSQVHIEIREGQFSPIPIALPKFFINSQNKSKDDNSIALNIRNIIVNDLDSSGLFKISRPSLQENSAGSNVFPNTVKWRNFKSQVVVSTDITINKSEITIQYRLWDVYTGSQLLTRQLSGKLKGSRRMAHIIADAIYERLTGESGYFDTRIAYISESGSPKNRIKRLAIMDQDGANHQFLTNGKSLVLTPRFDLKGKNIAYLKFINGASTVHFLNLSTLKTQYISSYSGITFSPHFEPNGDSVLFTKAIKGNSDIIRRNLKTDEETKLTSHPGIDVSPSASPDGNYIVFNSNRSGSAQLYVMNADGSNKKRITFNRGTYFTPAWSPRGDLIAFTLLRRGLFSIGLMNTDGSNERILTESWHDEGPSWSPNGRRILFFRSSPYNKNGLKTSRLFSIDIEGFNIKSIKSYKSGSDPAWSPKIQD